MRDTFLHFTPLPVGAEEAEAAADAVRSGWLTTGPRVSAFEEAFAARVGAPEAVALSSCTAGLHVSLAALGIGPGDEVITTPITFAASVNCIEHVGARPVLVDVEPDTLNIDPEAVAEAVGPRTRAILPVHFAGHPVELDPLRQLAEDRGLHLVEDAAHALPARYRGRSIGDGSNPVAFSFYATKNLTTGEGGMLTGPPELLEQVRILSLHGMDRDSWNRYGEEGSWFYEISTPGFKYNMTDIQAAIGLVQLGRLEALQARRREIVARYSAAFAGNAHLETPIERPHVESAWHLYVLRLVPEALSIDRNRFIEEMKARNIGTSVHFIPIHVHPYYRDRYGYEPTDFPVAFGAYERIVSLPLSPALSDADVSDVIEAVVDICDTFAR